MVRVSSFSLFNAVIRPFFCGRNPSKQNRSHGMPEFTKAGTKAVGPGKHSISIASIIQHEPTSDQQPRKVPLIIMTHEADEQAAAAANDEIRKLPSVSNECVKLRVT